jgi:hypothetical protein
MYQKLECQKLATQRPLPEQAVWQAVRIANNSQAGQDCGHRASALAAGLTVERKKGIWQQINKLIERCKYNATIYHCTSVPLGIIRA